MDAQSKRTEATERLSKRLEVRATEEGRLEGYAAVFYDGTDDTEYPRPDGRFERIMSGAFDETLAGGQDVIATVEHELHPRSIIGRLSAGTLQLQTDRRGLRYSVDLPETTAGRDIAESVRRGDVNGSSFAFIPRRGGVENRRDGDKMVRELRSVDVYDVGPVSIPAYSGATVSVRKEERGAPKYDPRRHVGKTIERWPHRQVRSDTYRRLLFRECAPQHFGLWCIEPRWFEAAHRLFVAGDWPVIRAEDGESNGGRTYEIRDDTAIVPLFGQLQKGQSSLGGTSTAEAGAAIRAADADDAVERIVLSIDSPGGTVAGTDQLAHTVRSVKKPIYAHIDDLGASAAYWIASQTQHISASPMSLVGSIGTMAVVRDVSERNEREGIRTHVIATGARKGDFVPGAAVTEEAIESLRREVEDRNRFFLGAVARGRKMKPSAVEALADGSVYSAEEALGNGLIDSVSYLDDFVGATAGDLVHVAAALLKELDPMA